MARHTGSSAEGATIAFVSWLVTGAVGPALVALPVNLVANRLAGAAARWFKRLRKTDDLSRLVKAAAESSVDLNDDEFKALRALLEKEQTWILLAEGKLNEQVEVLIGYIADCLAPRDGRTAKDSRDAAEAIARGLLEFAVYDLKESEIFQKVVQVRLKQMTDQAGALDEALFRMHKDLYYLADQVKDLFKLVSDRLPPGLADLSEIKIYLKTLLNWLNTDPWPQDQRLGGPVLTPAVIERKLRVGVAGTAHEQDADADELARQCSRLVILGSPGSGKTWLAMRIARICAEEALAALEDDATLDEVELPLYTTCSHLINTPGDIRNAAASSALDWIGDLGGSRIIKALHRSFTEREAEPTLLVIDSLDEASDINTARERLRQADSLRQPWRVVLTSRKSSWNNQLNIEEKNQGHRVGELQPLRYPSDVEPVIRQWFADKPEHGQALSAQIAGRPGLQQAATVPLILAFYCILGGGKPLPEYRHELYGQVVNRMLRSPWRSTSGPLRDMDACRAALRAWAWHGAKNYQTYGVGKWEDEVPTEDTELSPAGQDAVDHIAAPLGGPDFDTNETLRRFVHRSIREHLVAEHVARLPAEQAVHELLPHLWHDPDWEYAAPAAIATHGKHDKVLRALLCRASRSKKVPGHLSVIDGGGQMRRLLARVAAESNERDWSPELAMIIGQARVDLAKSGIADDLGEAVHWPTSNRQVGQVLLGRLTADGNYYTDPWPVDAIARLDPTGQHQRQVREALLGQLRDEPYDFAAASLVQALAGLAPTPADKRQAWDVLLILLASRHTGPADSLVDALARLDPAPDYKREAREALLERLTHVSGDGETGWLVGALVQFGPTDEDQREAREALLERLTRETDTYEIGRLVGALVRLNPTEEDEREARWELLERLTQDTSSDEIGRLVGALVQLDPTEEDKRQVQEALLGLLADESYYFAAASLAQTLAQLDPTPEDKRQARETILERLTHETHRYEIGELVGALVRLDPTEEDKRQVREALLVLLTDSTRRLAGAPLLSTLAQLSRANFGPLPPSSTGLVGALVRIDPTTRDKHKAREVLLERLTRETDSRTGIALVGVLVQLDPTPEDKRRARSTLLTLLAREPYYFAAAGLARALTLIDPTAPEQRRIREALLTLLTGNTQSTAARDLVGALARLDPTPEDKRQARETILERLVHEDDSHAARELMDTLTKLDPTVQDLSSWNTWASPPPGELLATARRNSVLDEWLSTLPSLRSLSLSPMNRRHQSTSPIQP
jgi:hypothetical protein